MAKSANIIRILELPRGAFNKHRPVSDLLWTQAENLAAAVIRMIESERRAIDTEEQASAFIKKYGAFLRPQADDTKPAASLNGAVKKAAPSPNNGAVKKVARSSSKVAMKTMKKPPRSSKR
jgi:hypothetical protein